MSLFSKKNKKKNMDTKVHQKVDSEKIFIQTNDEINKTDGVVTIATVEQNKITMKDEMVPKGIDINQRKESLNKHKQAQTKKRSRNINDVKKANNITSIIVLLSILVIGGGYYYYQYLEEEKSFELKTITLELGKKLAPNVKDYLNKKHVDEKMYTLNLEGVKENKVGQYEYRVTNIDGITKKGTINVVDTTSPQVETKDYYIKVNKSFVAQDFVNTCDDLSECSYFLENDKDLEKTKVAGEYTIHIIIKDTYGNTTRKKANLFVVQNIETLNCKKITDYTSTFGYTYNEDITITIADNNFVTRTHRTELTFNDEDKYFTKKEEYSKLDNYLGSNDKKKQIVLSNEAFTNGLTSLTAIKEHYESQGYKCNIN